MTYFISQMAQEADREVTSCPEIDLQLIFQRMDKAKILKHC
jgi:hypothetical protein